MTNRQLSVLESGYLMALCVMDLYALQTTDTQPLPLTALQFAATQGLDWNEYEELAEWLAKKGIVNENEAEHRTENADAATADSAAADAWTL